MEGGGEFMSSIDNRVVELELENRQFESGVKTSLKSLAALKEGLDFTRSTKNLNELERESKRFSLDGISTAIETVRYKFDLMTYAGLVAFERLVNSAITTGERMVKALSVDQIAAGFQKYTDKTSAVQTIMNATGESIDVVTEKLAKLQWFTDETSYSYVDMVSNIGKFTSQNVPLDRALSAMEGIAIVAADAGQNTQAASRAMYNFAQALGVGSVKLMDWRSIENANMATTKFKQTIMDTAVELGTLTKTTDGYKTAVKGTEVTMGSFSNTLSEGWFSSEVLLRSLGKYSEYADQVYELQEAGETCADAMERLGDMGLEMASKAFKAAQQAKTFTEALDATKDAVSSGWMQTFEIIFGNYEESVQLWTAVTNALWDIFASGAEARNELLQGWKDLGGRTRLLESFANVYERIGTVVGAVKDAFREIFPRTTSEQLYSITKAIHDFTENFQISETVLNSISKAFKGIFSVLNIFKQAILAAGKATLPLFKYVGLVSDVIVSFAGAIGGFLTKTADFVTDLDIFNKAFKLMSTVLKPVGVVIEYVLKSLTNLFNKVGDSESSGGSATLRALGKSIKALGEIDTTPIKNVFKAVGSGLSKIDEIGGKVVKGFSGFKPIIQGIIDIAGKLATTFGKLFTALWTLIANGIENFDIQNLGLMVIIEYFVLFSKNLNNFISGLSKLTKRSNDFVSNVKYILDGVRVSFEAYQKNLKAKSLLKLAGAIALLTGSLFVLSQLDSQQLGSALTGMAGLLAEILGSVMIFEKIMGNKKGLKALNAIISPLQKLSVSILILSVAMKILADLDMSQVLSGLIRIGGLATVLVVAAKQLSQGEKRLVKGAGSLVIFASAIYILSGVLKKIGQLDFKTIIKGLVGLAGVMAELVIFTKTIGSTKGMVSAATGFTILAAAMLVFSKAISSMGKMSLKTMGKGLLAMGSALAIVVVAMKNIPTGLVGSSVAMIAMATAVTILSKALESLGKMKMTDIGKSLLVLTGALLAISTALIFMQGTLSGSAAMLVMTRSLAALIPVIKSLGKMSLKTIGKALLTLVGIFTVLGGSALILQPLIPTMISLAGAMALFGAGVLAVGAGVLALSIGLTALSGSATAVTAAIVAVITAIIGLIPMIATQIGKGIVAILNVIASSAMAFSDAIIALGAAVMNAINTLRPDLVMTVVNLIVLFLETISIHMDEIIEAGVSMILSLLAGLANAMPQLIDGAYQVIEAFAMGITTKIPDIIRLGYNIVAELLRGVGQAMLEKTPELFSAFVQFGLDTIAGLAKGIWDGASSVISAAINVAKSALNAAKSALGIHSPSKEFAEIGKFVDMGFAKGVEDNTSTVVKSTTDLGRAAISAFSSSLENISDDFDPVIRPVVDMSNVEESSKLIEGIFGKDRTLSIDANAEYARRANPKANYTPKDDGDYSDKSPQTVTNLTYNQYNNSPKALSRIDIYRQTKNQLSTIKEALA